MLQQRGALTGGRRQPGLSHGPGMSCGRSLWHRMSGVGWELMGAVSLLRGTQRWVQSPVVLCKGGGRGEDPLGVVCGLGRV